MKNAFREIPEAILNTRSISERCNVEFKLGTNLLPVYRIGDDQTPEGLLEKLASEGLFSKFGPKLKEIYRERLKRELDIIKKMGYASYFLIVWDFISYAKKRGIELCFRIRLHPFHGDSKTIYEGILTAAQMGIISLDSPGNRIIRIRLTKERANAILGHVTGGKLFIEFTDRIIDIFSH